MKNETNYIFLRNNKDKMFEGLNIEEYFSIKNNSIIFKIFRKMNMLTFLFGKWKKQVKDYECFIFFENGYNKCISNYIKKKNKNCKIIMYFWNIIEEHKEYMEILKDKNIDEFWTFDKNDAKKYDMNYNPQFYSDKIKIDKSDIQYDFLFLGRAKDRKKELLELEEILKEKGFSTNFKIIENEKDYISYDEYLKLVSQSKCIIDYNQNRQIGLSLRPMEALFFNKKLITNNKDIKNYDFYSENNIFILDKEIKNDIKKFMNQQMEEINPDIIKKYNIDSWLNRFGIK